MKKTYQIYYFSFLVLGSLFSCTPEQAKDTATSSTADNAPASIASAQAYKEGNDYVLFERVRIVDRTAFSQPAEAYSLLLPKGWKQESKIIWNLPGSDCAGTFRALEATSADNQYRFQVLPDVLFTWNSNPELMQFYQDNKSSSPYCTIGQPIHAEHYLRNIFGPEELGNPQIVKVESNPLVVEEMEQSNERARMELMQYGSANIAFDQSAINATIRWPDGKEGMVVLGVSTLENTIPNIYTGTTSKSYTTQVTKRMVYTYPAEEAKQALSQFSVIMGSFRTNPSWNETVNNFWANVRQQKQIEHIGKLQLMDAQTKAIGEATIRKGEARLKEMDMDLRSWEQRQSAQDRMHTSFVKTIREVENYQDETGTMELASGYNHAWSRGDGSTFIMSDNASFNPGTVFQDQAWKEMKKVE